MMMRALQTKTQALQAMQMQMADQNQALATQMSEQMQTIAEKVGGTPNDNQVGAGRGGNQSRAKGRLPEKLDRDVDYATFLQWEKSWNLYVVNDQLHTLTEGQRTAIFFSLFTKELLSDLQYRFKMSVDADQKVEEVIDQMKAYLKEQRSIVLAMYNLFTCRQQQGETFDNWSITSDV